ncbi:uncharacterized protein PAC_19447 [Phialocephala subalpina]|uniref:CHAT domain-containing protein n=1 Tax=Phialocephala subalpina TaxID=576137 RepID=A0A1L7XX10_9HELO|nr:uncharacterized protein PAC_19447 [Phialocephala subalpina]
MAPVVRDGTCCSRWHLLFEMAPVVIREVAGPSSSGGSEWSFTIETASTEPSMRTETICPSSSAEEEKLRWYLEQYAIGDLYDKERAETAESYLAKYSQCLFSSVLEHCESSQALDIDIHEDNPRTSSFHSIHWELLEHINNNLGSCLPARVTRVIDSPEASWDKWKDEFEILKSFKTFNILIFVSRPDITTKGAREVSHQLISRPLFDLLASFSEGLVTIEVARPGTWNGLRNHLENAKSRGKVFHLVHLDVHGSTPDEVKGGEHSDSPNAYLQFYPENDFGDNNRISATRVGRVLRKHYVPCVILNACRSARSDIGWKANLAKVFVSIGIPLVLAMSYELTDSAAVRFMTDFYHELLLCRKSLSESAHAAREALWKHRSRKGRFGLSVDLQDWIIPVVYKSKDGPFEEELRSLIPALADRRWQAFYLKREFFQELASWWLKTGLTKTVIHIRYPDQNGLTPEVLNRSPEWHFSGEYVNFQRDGESSPASHSRNLLDFAKFLQTNEMEAKRHGQRSTETDFLFILDGVYPFARDGTNIFHDDLWTNLLKIWSDFNVLFLIGSYCDLSWFQEDLGGVPLLTTSGDSAEPSSGAEATGFQIFLRNPQQWRRLESLFDWGLHIPALNDLIHAMVAKFGPSDTQRIFMSYRDVFNLLYESEEQAESALQAIPGFKHAEKIYHSLSIENRERLLCLAPFSTAVPYDAERFVDLVLSKMSLAQKPKTKTEKESNGKDLASMDELFDYLSIHGLIGHKEHYRLFEFKDGDRAKPASRRVYCKLHPALTLFLRHELMPRLGVTKGLQFDRLFLLYNRERLAVLNSRELPEPLQVLSERDPDHAQMIFDIEKSKEEAWGFWNFASPMLTWLDDRQDHSDLLYPKMFFRHFMEPKPLGYERLDDDILVGFAVAAICVLATEHDREEQDVNKPEFQNLMIHHPQRYWSIFNLILGLNNWLCRASREQDNHIEFNCWIRLSDRLLQIVEKLKSGSRERQLEMEPWLGDLEVQMEGARQLLLLRKLWPDKSVQFDIMGESIWSEDLIRAFPELEPLANVQTDHAKLVQKATRKDGRGLAKISLKAAWEIPLELRVLGIAPEHDGVPWPEPELKSQYLELKEKGLVNGSLSSFSWAASKLRDGKMKWVDIRNEAKLRDQDWLTKGLPNYQLHLMDLNLNAKVLNQLYIKTLMANEQWNGCLVFLGHFLRDDNPNVDKARHNLDSAYCLQRLERWDESARQLQEAFSHIQQIENEENSRFELLRSLYTTVKSWPDARNYGATPSIGEILTLALKIGFHESKATIYAHNGTLLKLLITEIASRISNMEDNSDETFEFSSVDSDQTDEDDFLKKIRDMQDWDYRTKEELEEEAREDPPQGSIMGDVLHDAHMYNCVAGDLYHSINNLETSIMVVANRYGSKLYMQPSFLERVRSLSTWIKKLPANNIQILIAKGYILSEDKDRVDSREDKSKSMADGGKDEAETSSTLHADGEEASYVEELAEMAKIAPSEGNVGTAQDVAILEGVSQDNSSIEVLELLLETRRQHEEVTATDIIRRQRLRMQQSLNWRREHHLPCTGFLTTLRDELIRRDPSERPGVWTTAEDWLMGVKESPLFW